MKNGPKMYNLCPFLFANTPTRIQHTLKMFINARQEMCQSTVML